MKLTQRLSCVSEANNIHIGIVLQSGTKLTLTKHSPIITVSSEKYKLCDPRGRVETPQTKYTTLRACVHRPLALTLVYLLV
jgi:hypothetical protein